jgi:fatty-acyl-CoA synthase
MRLGAVAVPINLTYEAKELGRVLTDAEPELVISIDAFDRLRCAQKLAIVDQALVDGATEVPALPSVRRVVILPVDEPGWVDPHSRGHELIYGGDTLEPLDAAGVAAASDPAYIVSTTGTTAFPKAAECAHRTFAGTGTAFAAGLAMGPDDRYINFLPIFHVAGPAFLVAAHGVGAAIHLTGFFEAGRVLEEIERGRCTCASGFPTNLTKLLGHPSFAGRDVTSFKKVNIGGTPAYHDHLRAAMDLELLTTVYGSTESGGTISMTDPDEADPVAARESNGTILPGIEVRIVDPETGLECPTGTLGEITFRGWARFLRYLPGTAPEDHSLDAEGFFHSGDRGYVDDSGHLFYRGRYKMMIKSGGENVSELEVEMFLEQELPGVEVAQVVGSPDPVWGEAVVAFIQPREQTAALTSEQLRDLCRGKLAGFKIPRRFIVMGAGDWPLAPTGKIDKSELRRIASEPEIASA